MDNEQYIYIHVVSCVHGSVDLSICCPNKKEPGFQDMVSDPELSSFVLKNTSCTTSLEQEAYFMSRISISFSKLNYLALKINDSLLEVLSGCSILYLSRGYGTKKLANLKFIHGISSFRKYWDWSWTVFLKTLN